MAEGKFQGNKTDGSLGNPYLIEDVQDLNAIRFYPTKNFKLAKTINLGVYPYNTGKGWMPIDNFSGTLDGDGYKILNLYVNRPAQDNCGLFARILENTNVTLQVKNVYFENANIHGRNNVGIIAGYLQINEITKLQSEPFFSQCKIVGKVQGSNNLGLVLGHLNWVTELNQPCTFANNMSIKGQVAIDIKGSNYSGVLGLTSNTKQSLAIHHTICDVSFNRHVSNVDTDLNPDFWGATTLTSSDSFYNKDAWEYGTTDEKKALGMTFQQMTHRENLADLDKQIDNDGNMLWNFKKDIRIPELTLFLRTRHYVQLSDGYYIYDFSSASWIKKADKLLTRDVAYMNAMTDIDKITFQGWEELNKKLPADNKKFKLIAVYDSSAGTEILSKDKTDAMTLYDTKTMSADDLKRKFSDVETKVFTYKISFTEKNEDEQFKFGNTIFNIESSIVK